jgi:hypothetical protein
VSRFARIPERFTARLARGEITFDHYGVMTFIVASADYRTRQALFPSLKALKDAARWKRTPQHLRDVLRELRALREVHYEMEERSKAPYVFTILPNDYFERPSANALQTRDGVSFAEGKSRLQSEESANADQQTDSGDSESPAVCSDSPSTSKALRRGEDVLGLGDQGGGEPVSLALDGLDPDVREKVEKGRAERTKDAGIDFDYFGTARLDEIEDTYREER